MGSAQAAQRSGPARGRLAHLPGLDGLRGLAVLGVLAFHSGIGAVSGGFLGVSLFFTLSGFLITLLLLDEHQATGTIGLPAFWGRRFRRLLPAALLAIALATLVLWRAGDAGSLHAFRGDGFAALGYVANWHFIVDGQSYASLFQAPSPLLHFWSLAIEEQFYLLFPLVALGVLRAARGSRRTFALVLGAMFVTSALLPSVLGSDDRVYFGTDTRAAELLAGALLAVGLSSLLARHARHRDQPVRGLDTLHELFDAKGRRVMGLLGIAAVVGMLAMWVTTSQSTRWVYTGGLPIYAALTGFVIFSAVLPGSPVARALAIRPLRWVGLISYGIYLYHWPVLWVLTPERTGLAMVPRLALAAAITVGLALASYHLVEQPIRTGVPVWRPHLRPASAGAARFRLPRPGLLLAGPVAVLIVVVLVFSVSVTGQTPTVDLAGAQAGTLVNTTGGFAGDPGDLTAPAPVAPSTTAPTPTSTAPSSTAPSSTAPAGPLPAKAIVRPTRPLRVLLVGDSTTVFLTPALNAWGGENGVWGAANYARIGCGLGRGGSRMNHDKAEPVPPQCGDWAKDWPPVLRELKPDLIVISTGFWDATDRQLPGDAEWRHPGDPTYDAYMKREFAGAADTLLASGAPVAWIDNPPIQLGRRELGAAADYPVNDPHRMTRTNEIINEVAATRPAMRVIPYTAFMNAWPGGPLDPQLRPDGLHVDGPGGPLVAPWLGPEILAAYWDIKAGRPTPPR